jgi:pentose-5-phosphate-3-epimerase
MPVMDPSFVDNVTVLKLYTELKITEWNNNIAVLVLISVKPGKKHFIPMMITAATI